MGHPNGDDDEISAPIVHDESNWLVSYADMMTLLFGFFVLMYSMSRVDDQKFEVVSKDVAKFFGGKVKEDTGIRVTAQDLQAALGALMKKLEPAREVPDSETALIVGGLGDTEQTSAERDGFDPAAAEVSQEGRTLTLKFRGSILFTPGSAQIRPEFEKMLNEVSQRLKASGRVQNIRVEGHTDGSPIKSMIFPTNWELSAARAARVVRQFEANGFEKGFLVAQGYGSSQPEAPEAGGDFEIKKANMAKNRRVVIHVDFAAAKGAQDETAAYFEKVRRAKAAADAVVGDSGAVGDARDVDDVERRIAEAKSRLEETRQRLRAKQEAEKKEKKLKDLEKKLEDLKRKADEADRQSAAP